MHYIQCNPKKEKKKKKKRSNTLPRCVQGQVTVFGFHSSASLGKYMQNLYPAWSKAPVGISMYAPCPSSSMLLATEMVCIPGKESPIFSLHISILKKTEDDNDSEDEMGGTVVRGR